MGAPAFTPGTWQTSGGSVVAVTGDNVEKVARCFGLPGDERMLADARLISAAKWLYDACEDAVQALALLRLGLLHDRHAIVMIDTHIDELKTALAKAGGDSQ